MFRRLEKYIKKMWNRTYVGQPLDEKTNTIRYNVL
jgi:hypothetical protein